MPTILINLLFQFTCYWFSWYFHNYNFQIFVSFSKNSCHQQKQAKLTTIVLKFIRDHCFIKNNFYFLSIWSIPHLIKNDFYFPLKYFEQIKHSKANYKKLKNKLDHWFLSFYCKTHLLGKFVWCQWLRLRNYLRGYQIDQLPDLL